MKQAINFDEQPIRLFKYDFLEFFTHIQPAVIVVIWTPVVVWNLYRPFLDPDIALSAGLVAVAFLIGIVVWSFTEYTMHRFVFHFEPKNPGPTMQRVIYLFHGVHHHQPRARPGWSCRRWSASRWRSDSGSCSRASSAVCWAPRSGSTPCSADSSSATSAMT